MSDDGAFGDGAFDEGAFDEGAPGEPAPDDDALARAEAEAADDAAATAVPPATADDLTSADYSTVFSPRNLAVGLAVVAGLVAFAASRRRRNRREGD